jgi:DNA-nicking Smr family endonuclease
VDKGETQQDTRSLDEALMQHAMRAHKDWRAVAEGKRAGKRRTQPEAAEETTPHVQQPEVHAESMEEKGSFQLGSALTYRHLTSGEGVDGTLME